jgi:DNA polymerase III gamma/tau subunit
LARAQLAEATVRQMLGSVDRSYVFRLLDALATVMAKRWWKRSEALRIHGLSAASTLEEMSAVLQRMAVLQAVPDLAGDDDPIRSTPSCCAWQADAGRRNPVALQPVPARPW